MTGMKSSHVLLGACCAFALAGCETIGEEVNEAVGFEYTANLTGASGSGKAEISLNDATNMICTDLELTSGVNMTAGHILGPGGTVVADIDVPDDNDSDDCDNISDAVLDGIKANPGAYSVHVAATNGDLTGRFVKES